MKENNFIIRYRELTVVEVSAKIRVSALELQMMNLTGIACYSDIK
ncbi:hypothetical protein HMPREF3182_01527 [Megasphaera hutchinsoni]|jgi:hypothetical protein|uniref:Uncharacterized protein n=1 Tax=Megasphaera hutchinsoni TaxID=1588748 RepID=A0A134CDF1_9FIRM|nr:hypothetical protein HMPREF3182_01527 [Megasphaera hutchinsoni]